MNQELISIIVPVYKVEKYIRHCVESVLNQTYKNIECILVDDGSPDNCPRICDEFAEKDNRIKVIHKQNGGLSSARNMGIDNAKGKYIVFVDSDDYIHPQMIEILFEKLIHENADISICNIEYVFENSSIQKEYISPIKNEVIGRKELLEKLLQKNASFYVVMCNKLYKKELWNNLRFPVGEIHEDEALIHDIFLKCDRAVSVDKKLYFYFQRIGSIMHTEKSDRDLIVYLMLSERYNKIHGIVDDMYLKNRIQLEWIDFMDVYYQFWNKNSQSVYLKKMKQALWKVLPLMREYRICCFKERLSIIIFMMSSELYKRMFYERGRK